MGKLRWCWTVEGVARDGVCGGCRGFKNSRNTKRPSIYRLEGEKVSPENIPVTDAGFCWCLPEVDEDSGKDEIERESKCEWCMFFLI